MRRHGGTTKRMDREDRGINNRNERTLTQSSRVVDAMETTYGQNGPGRLLEEAEMKMEGGQKKFQVTGHPVMYCIGPVISRLCLVN